MVTWSIACPRGCMMHAEMTQFNFDDDNLHSGHFLNDSLQKIRIFIYTIYNIYSIETL